MIHTVKKVFATNFESTIEVGSWSGRLLNKRIYSQLSGSRRKEGSKKESLLERPFLGEQPDPPTLQPFFSFIE